MIAAAVAAIILTAITILIMAATVEIITEIHSLVDPGGYSY